MALAFRNLSFTYDSATQALFVGLQTHFPCGWTGVVGPNGSGKTTLLKLAVGMLQPQAGTVGGAQSAGYCAQRTDDIPAEFDEFIGSTQKAARRLKGRLKLGGDWPDRWGSLSHGERKRAQLAVALWHEPDVLAVDEPTNHLDSYARDLLNAALAAFAGVGILVSHDRELLDDLCGQCLFVDPPHAVMRPGGYTQGARQQQAELEHDRQRYHQARGEAGRLKTESARRRQAASRGDKRHSKRNLARKDSDGRAKIDMARISGRDAVGGKLLRQMHGRLKQAEQTLADITLKKEHRLSFWLPGSKARRDALFSIPPADVSLGAGRRLSFPELVMHPADRIALSGPTAAARAPCSIISWQVSAYPATSWFTCPRKSPPTGRRLSWPGHWRCLARTWGI